MPVIKESKKKEDTDVVDFDNIPMYRRSNLYIILICGIVISLIGLYMYFSADANKEYTFFDGDGFQDSKPNPLFFILSGLIICIFPLYHFYKGNHKPK